MANVAKGGLRYVGNVNSNKPRVFRAPVATAYANRLSWGDVVIAVSDGTVATCIGSEGTPSTIICGVVYGAVYKENGVMRSNSFLPASTAHSGLGAWDCAYVDCYDPLGAIFEVDADDGTTITTIAGAYNIVGENCDTIWTAGTAANGVSATLMDISGHHVSTTKQLRIVGVAGGRDRVDNDVTLTRAKYLVEFNQLYTTRFQTTGV